MYLKIIFIFYRVECIVLSMDSRYTYEELRKLTGASLSSLSRVFNNLPGVNDKKRKEIIDRLVELGYNRERFELEKEKRKLIIFNIPSLDNPFYNFIIRGARDAAERNHFDVLISENPLSNETFDSFMRLIHTTKASGIITTSTLSRENLKQLSNVIPVVQCCECITDMNIPYITVNDRLSAKNAMRHLLSIGRRKIAFINGPMNFKYSKERLSGYKDALSESGIEYDDDYVIELPKIDYEMALSSASQLLNSPKRPDAFFASSDVCAAAAVKAASRLNLSVPGDVAIVGFDNIEISYMLTPSLTPINQPRYQMGLLSADMITRMINKETISMKYMLLDTELIIRESTVGK